MKLKNKVVIVTGASSGIGRAAALEFARRGASVSLAARRADELEEVAAQCRALNVPALAIPTDVTDRLQAVALIEKTAAELGPPDVLVNNAGFAIFDPIETADASEVEAMMQTNYLGAVHCIKAALPHMLGRRSGVIVNVASIAGLMGFSNMGAYCATKFALVGLSEALRSEIGGRGVGVVLVCPGTTETDFFRKAERGKMPAASRLILAVSPERVARAIVNATESGRYRVIVPAAAGLFIRFKELCPRTAHLLMRGVSNALAGRRR